MRFLVGLFLAVACHGQEEPRPFEADWIAHDFHFGSGEVVPELRLHYLTLGTPQRDASGHLRNGVLILHDLAGESRPFLTAGFLGALFLKGQPLDAGRYYLILPDAIGHGDSSKPSDGLRDKFPHYDDADIVRAQYLLLHEALKVDHLRLVLGIGMGGMQTWLWGERYPDFMDALMPLASSPAQIAGRHRLFRDLAIDSLRADPQRGLVIAQFVQLLMTASAAQLQEMMPAGDVADAQFQTLRKKFARTSDAGDLLYQYEASRNFDAEPDLAKIRARLLAINFADDELNPPELGILERAIKLVPHGRYVLTPASTETRGHNTAMRARVWRDYVSELLR